MNATFIFIRHLIQSNSDYRPSKINTIPTEAHPTGHIVSNAEDLLGLFDADFGTFLEPRAMGAVAYAIKLDLRLFTLFRRPGYRRGRKDPRPK